MFSTVLASLTFFWFCFLCVYFGHIFSPQNNGTNQLKWGHSIITFTVREGEGFIKMQTYTNGESGGRFSANVRI